MYSLCAESYRLVSMSACALDYKLDKCDVLDSLTKCFDENVFYDFDESCFVYIILV